MRNLPINDEQDYSAIQCCNFLKMKYSSVIALFRKNGIEKINNRYSIKGKKLKALRDRENQTFKFLD